jgi:YhcH/YjgK/YiaL family protein
MILGSLADSAVYEPLGARIAAGFAYLRAFDPATPDGRHDVQGDDVFALVSTYDTGPSTVKRFEAHRAYLDIQFVARGMERVLHAPVASLALVEDFAADGDVAFFADPPQSSSFLLQAGDFAIFHPGDAHKPGCMAGGRHTVQKVVVKVRI